MPKLSFLEGDENDGVDPGDVDYDEMDDEDSKEPNPNRISPKEWREEMEKMKINGTIPDHYDSFERGKLLINIYLNTGYPNNPDTVV